jgi:hypothetical protein
MTNEALSGIAGLRVARDRWRRLLTVSAELKALGYGDMAALAAADARKAGDVQVPVTLGCLVCRQPEVVHVQAGSEAQEEPGAVVCAECSGVIDAMVRKMRAGEWT